jgi:hypothetical protein
VTLHQYHLQHIKHTQQLSTGYSFETDSWSVGQETLWFYGTRCSRLPVVRHHRKKDRWCRQCHILFLTPLPPSLTLDAFEIFEMQVEKCRENKSTSNSNSKWRNKTN